MYVKYNMVHDVLGQALFKNIVWLKKNLFFFFFFWKHFSQISQKIGQVKAQHLKNPKGHIKKVFIKPSVLA
jgi:hypothetical protein